ncbi:MAG TPA: DUF3105 domain-containing protein [Dermatophilaceae bacterium]|nr:DUF3105 domain-containing protein [Dermatophilaceae bacterium]
MPKKQVSQDRKARIAEMQQLEKQREHRVRLRIIAGATALLLVLAAVITYAVLDGRNNQPDVAIESIGVSAAAASCDPATTDPASGNGSHVGPGTSSPETGKVTYDTVPPSTGPHFAEPAASNTRNFYTAKDRPEMELLVHNLEHGYTVLWYDVAAGEAKKAELEHLAEVANKTEWAKDKFIVSAWDTAYGELPAGKKFALSHWSATLSADGSKVDSQAGHRQLCGDLSGAVVKAFVKDYPRTSAPEPGAA